MVGKGVEIYILEEGILDSNTYLISVGEEVAIIDPGAKPERIPWEIRSMRKTAIWAAATHGHFDHMDSAKQISEELVIPFYLHPEDRLLIEGKAPSQISGNSLEDDFDFIFELEESKRPQCLDIPIQVPLMIGGVEVEVIETPGHSFGSVSFYIAKAAALFCGDTFANIGKFKSEEQFKHSIAEFRKLPEETRVFPGHGEPITVSKLLEEIVKPRN